MIWLLLFLLVWFAGIAFGLLLLRAASREAPVPDAMPRKEQAAAVRRQA